MNAKTTASGLLAALGAVLLLGQAGSAAAAEPAPSGKLQPTQVGPALGALPYVIAPAKDLRLDPFAQSGADPLSNVVAVKPDNGMKPLSSTGLTSGLSNGGGAKDIPGAKLLLSALPG
ncbi:hypothetical protein P3T36_007778 [Kitasatospora sp. MAP12-15]|uniref:hypothetical protein n=1 Tax=unclassified Kitasatospora TaxID=2633591 RepID=UPI0024765A02|nr:hypothetical protein [Kitasatospora sp. MAP12-44]MDH6111136.1 hypothetical protein [Kitasatospora sp. MAP12-44]